MPTRQYQPIAEPVLVPAPPAVPALSWAPVFADWIAPPRAVPVSAIPACAYVVGAVVSGPAVPALSWAPVFADLIWPVRGLQTAEQVAYLSPPVFAMLPPDATVQAPFLILPAGNRMYVFDAVSRTYVYPATARTYIFLAKDRSHIPEGS